MREQKNDEFLIFGSPLIEEQEIEEVVQSLRCGWIGTGPKVHQLETMFKEYKGIGHAMALNSCTAALHLSMIVLGISPGDEVIVPAMTFAATANAVIHAGGTPVFADCLKDTMNIDPQDLEAKITPRTKAVIIVHFAGRPCRMDEILDICRRHNIKLVEDCAHAIEAEHNGRKTGTFGDIGCFSFYVTKNIITGEGGMAITNNDEYADRIKVMALHGMSKDAWKRFSDDGYKHYQVVYPGFKYNMMDIQAAMGIHQLPRVEDYWTRRKAVWQRYMEAFADLPAFLPADTPHHVKHSYHLFTLLLDIDRLRIDRDGFLEEMTRRKLGVGVHYLALHLHPYYQEAFGYKEGDFPNAEWISHRTVSLPLSPKLRDQDVERVIFNVRDILEKFAK